MNWSNPIGGGFKSNKAQRKQNQIVLLSQTKTLGNANLIEENHWDANCKQTADGLTPSC